MNTFLDIDVDVLLTTARVQAALQVIPRIIGPKEAWAHWMRDNLDGELAKLPPHSAGSPRPRLLGSLDAMLFRHYSGGMTMDTLCFDDVRADDPSITDTSYVDVPADALPDLVGTEFWWQEVPPSITLSVPGKAKDVLENTTTENVPVPLAENRPSGTPPEEDIGMSGTTSDPKNAAVELSDRHSSEELDNQTTTDPKGKRRSSVPEGSQRPRKKKKVAFKSIQSVTSDESDSPTAPSEGASLKGKGKADVPMQSEGPDAFKICDACKARGLACVWPTGTDASGSRNEKRVFSIRRPRGKAKASSSEQSTLQEKTDELKQLVINLSERVIDLEKGQAATEAEKVHLVTRIASLELQVARLKKVTKP